MTDLNQKLDIYVQLLNNPSIPLSRIESWVRQGRSRPRFYAYVWLSRVLRRYWS